MEIPRLWRGQTERYRLIGSNCPDCGKKHFPKRPVCPDCGYRGEIYNSSNPQTQDQIISIPQIQEVAEKVVG